MITMSEVVEAIRKMPKLTAKQADAYECSQKMMDDLMDLFKVEKPATNLYFCGVRLLVNDQVPYGSFYPADYLAGR